MTTRCRKQRCFVEQPLRRFDAFHHDAPRHGVQPCIFLGGQFAAGEDDNWDIAQIGIGAKLLQNLKSRHVGEFEVKHHAIARFAAKNSQCVRSRLCGDDFNVVCGQQLVMLSRSAALSSTMSKRFRFGPE